MGSLTVTNKTAIHSHIKYYFLILSSLLLLSNLMYISTASAQIPYTPEAEYNCDENLELYTDPSYYNPYTLVYCTISNDNMHEIKAKISTDWDYILDGPFSTSEWGYCETNSAIGDDVSVPGSTDYTLCFSIDADSYVVEGEYQFFTSMEIVSYSNGIPCNDCEPVEEEVTIKIMPWYRLDFETSSSPQGAYEWYVDREECKKVDSSEVVITIDVDGNFINTIQTEVMYDYRFYAYDLDNDDEEVVQYSKSKFGTIDLVYEPIFELSRDGTYSTTLSASWNIPEDTSNYEIYFRTEIYIYAGLLEGEYQSYQGWGSWEDSCYWEGIETPEQETKVESQTEQSGITVSLSNPYSGLSSILSFVFAALIARKR